MSNESEAEENIETLVTRRLSLRQVQTLDLVIQKGYELQQQHPEIVAEMAEKYRKGSFIRELIKIYSDILPEKATYEVRRGIIKRALLGYDGRYNARYTVESEDGEKVYPLFREMYRGPIPEEESKEISKRALMNSSAQGYYSGRGLGGIDKETQREICRKAGINNMTKLKKNGTFKKFMDDGRVLAIEVLKSEAHREKLWLKRLLAPVFGPADFAAVYLTVEGHEPLNWDELSVFYGGVRLIREEARKFEFLSDEELIKEEKYRRKYSSKKGNAKQWMNNKETLPSKIKDLSDKGFFDKPKKVSEVCKKIKELGNEFTDKHIDTILRNLTKSNELKRRRSSEGLWKYRAIKNKD